ncbi:TetR/AcrR family transcriptional regulator [Lactobacillus corticis]|uniref:HTH tetR-type domain-containing protein n=1 Tax=Lactobacillus corticis TaxID=2201249 RepID=A0A916VI04_9LACO|nr:TetR/AcrR family transcriptional regulator [Lactobacillus corticis]GFZ26745.1 hypothetical protein LCB40_06250 [Lactobacillus corticis]
MKQSQPEKIIHTARQLFAKYGYAAVSTHQIAKVAKVSQSQIRYYFSTKSGLLSAVIDNYAQDFLPKLKLELHRAASKQEKIQAIVAIFINNLQADRDNFTLMYELVQMAFSQHQPEITEFLNQCTQIVNDEIFHEKVPAMAKQLTGSLMGTSAWLLTMPDWYNHLDWLTEVGAKYYS